MSLESNETTDEQTNGSKNLLPFWVRLVFRIVALAAGVLLLFFADGKLLSRLANWATIVSLVGSFYLAIFEPQVLAWLISRVSKFLKHGSNRKVIKPPFPKPKFTIRKKRNAPPENIDKVVPANTPSNQPRRVLKESQTKQSFSPLWIIFIIIFTMFFLPIFIGTGPSTYNDSTLIAVDEKIVLEDSNELIDSSSNVVDEEVKQQSISTKTAHIITSSDRCYTIAFDYTGDGERFVELGPPINMGLDISHRDYCHIVPGENLNIPESWLQGK